MAAALDLEGTQAVAFDAVGTLIVPDPSPAAVYSAIAREHGIELNPDLVRGRFRSAFRREEEIDRAAGWRTNAEREVNRWQSIVAATLPEVADQTGCFRSLWDHFADPKSWRVLPESRVLIAAVAARGLPIAVASNFDSRLRAVLAGQPELPCDLRLAISSEVGWRKPARPFFTAVADLLERPPARILMIGDDLANDIEAARAAGMRAMQVSPH